MTPILLKPYAVEDPRLREGTGKMNDFQGLASVLWLQPLQVTRKFHDFSFSSFSELSTRISQFVRFNRTIVAIRHLPGDDAGDIHVTVEYLEFEDWLPEDISFSDVSVRVALKIFA